MRNLKKLLAVVVAICVLATFTVPAFAADAAAAKTDSQIATDLGVIKGAGTGVTAEYLATQPDRLQGAIMFLRLKGLEDTAKAFIGTDNFADVEGLSDTNKAILAYLKANPDLGFAGVGDNKFSPLTKMSAKEYYKVMLVALGYVYDTDFKWANVFSFAASKGLTGLIDNESFTVADLCKGTVEALKATVKGGTDTLIAKLVAGGSITAAAATASGLYNATPKALELVSATSDTLKTAKFVFNQELNSDTVKTDNFTGATLDKVVLLDDKKTVIVVLKDAKAEQSKTEDITVKNVKSTSGMTIAEVKKTVTFVDNTIPVISGVVAKNAKTLVITASEPMNAATADAYANFDGIKIDDSAIVAKAAVDFGKNTVVLTLSTLMAKGAHKIEIGKLKDFANYTAVTQTYNIDVAEDTTAPAIASAKMNTVNEIEVTFSEDVDELAKGTFWVNGTEITGTITQKATDKSVFTLPLPSALTIGATVEIKVEYKGQKDVVGNEVKDKTTFIFKVADDTTTPTVTAAIDGKNKIVLTFSKNMLKAGKMKVYDKDGKQMGSDISLAQLDGTVDWDGSSVVKIANTAGGTGLADMNAAQIKINLTDLKDGTVRANALIETNITLQAVDTKKPTVVANYKVTEDTADHKNDKIIFYFSEAMNADTLKNLSNYVVTTPVATAYIYDTNKALSAYSDVSVDSVASDNKSITIKAKGIYAAAGQGVGFQVYALQDTASNMMDAATVAAFGGGALTVDSAKATAENKVEVMFNQDIKSFAPGTFILYTTATGTSLKASILKGDIDGKKVTLTLDRNIGTGTADAFLYALDTTKVKNTFDGELTTGGAVFAGTKYAAIADGIRPTVKGFTATSSGIIVEFSELISTTGSTFNSQELNLTKDDVTITNAAISACDKDGNAAGALTSTKYILVSNLTANKEYKIQLFPKGITTDAIGNWFMQSEIKAVTPKP